MDYQWMNKREYMFKRIRSLVIVKLAIYPLLLAYLVAAQVFVDENAVSLAAYEVASNAIIILFLDFYKFAVFEVQVPSSLMYLLLAFDHVDSFAVLFVIEKRPLEGIAVSVGELAFSIHFIVFEHADVGEGVSALAEGEFSVALLLAIHELTGKLIPISVFNDSLAMEETLHEVALVCLILIDVLSLPVFLVVPELSIVDGTVVFFLETVSLLLAIIEPALVFCVGFEVLELAVSVELIFFELSLILSDALEEVLAFSLFLTVEEGALVLESIFGLEGSFPVVVVFELTDKFIAISKIILTVFAMFFALDHRALEPRAIVIHNFSIGEPAVSKDALEGSSVILFPKSLPVRF